MKNLIRLSPTLTEHEHDRTGGNAFPFGLIDNGTTIEVFYGMTLRDYFAAKAVQGYICSGVPGVDEKIATMAYEMADAMLLARKQ